MATYDDLTDAQKQEVDDIMRLIRPIGGTFAQSAQKAGVIIQGYNASAKAIIDTLDPGSEIPNKTDLAGAQPMTVEDVDSMVSDLTEVSSSFGTDEKLAIYIKAAGINSVIE